MKRIATIVENGRVVGLVHGADEPDQSIVVNGRKWRFDFDRMFGPLWLKSNGTTERKCQNPSRAVWNEFEKWHRAWLKNNPEPESATFNPQNTVTGGQPPQPKAP